MEFFTFSDSSRNKEITRRKRAKKYGISINSRAVLGKTSHGTKIISYEQEKISRYGVFCFMIELAPGEFDSY